MLSYILEIVLLLWFFGCIVTYRCGRVLLVEGMGVKSAEFGMFLVYGASIVLRFAVPNAGGWFMLAVLCVWLVVQYFCHWHFTIFGASQEKIDGYNQCFSNTLCIVPRRRERLIPDFYHIVLHLLIAMNILILFRMLL